MLKRKICVVTGSRAEYGLLSVVMKAIHKDPSFTLQIIATGMHLSPEFGLTYVEIEKDGFTIDTKVEMLLSSDTSIGIAKSISLGISGFADAFDNLKPDLILVLGDRFEILAAVEAALVAKIPIAHLAGGDTTEGAYDEAIRHSITKMSHLHFVTNKIASKRVHQLGENPKHIYMVGSPGIEVIKKLKLLNKENLERELEFKFLKKNLLVTFHPVTLDLLSAEKQFLEILNALDKLGNKIGVIFTKPNADNSGRAIIKMINNFVTSRPNTKAYTSLGQLRYLSLVSVIDVVVGNSSSGLYEVPSFHKPTVNIGDRQKGRLQASSILNCKPETSYIVKTIREALKKDCSPTVNPYGDGNSSKKIITILNEIPDYKVLLKKQFFDIIQ